MARIEFPEPGAMDEDLQASLRKYGSLNVTRMMAHQPRLMHAYARMGMEILRHGALDPRLRELVILRVGQLCGSEYETHQHVSVARMVGVTDAEIAACAAGDWQRFDEREGLALAVTDEIVTRHAASAGTIHAARQVFSPAELVELVMVVGYYVMTAGYLRSLDVDIEDGPDFGERIRQGLPGAQGRS